MFIKIRCFKYTAKKNIYYKIIKNYKLTISNEIINEGNKRNIIEKIQKKNEVNNEANKRNNYDENIISNQALNTVNKRNICNKIQEDNNDYDIITNELTKKEKMDFYYSVMDNNVEKFKSYINGTNSGKPYNILEEVSARGYKWTTFHYAMHYGRWNIIKFIFEYLIDLNLLDKALNMKTNDNRCPILCLFKSNNLSPQQKKEIYFKIINTFQIPLSEEVINEAKKKEFYVEIPISDNVINKSNERKLYVNVPKELF